MRLSRRRCRVRALQISKLDQLVSHKSGIAVGDDEVPLALPQAHPGNDICIDAGCYHDVVAGEDRAIAQGHRACACMGRQCRGSGGRRPAAPLAKEIGPQPVDRGPHPPAPAMRQRRPGPKMWLCLGAALLRPAPQCECPARVQEACFACTCDISSSSAAIQSVPRSSYSAAAGNSAVSFCHSDLA